MNYSVNIWKLFRRLIAWFLRQPVFVVLLGAVAAAMQTINDAFALFVSDTKYFLSFNGQIVYLERRLNDEFAIAYDPATRDANISGGSIIYIGSTETQSAYIFNVAELRDPVYLFNDAESAAQYYLYNDAENAAIDTDNFIIYIPTAVTFDENIIRSIVNAYKPAGKTYSITTY